MRKRHSKKQLRKHLAYDPVTGRFSWRVRRSHRSLSNEPGSLNVKGYRMIKIDSRSYSAHRLAWLFSTGVWPTKALDHKDGNKANNKLKNLRLATNSQNKQNGRKYRTNKSGFKGVHWDNEAKKWRAQIRVLGKGKTLGRFVTKQKARVAYSKAARKHFGEFARF